MLQVMNVIAGRFLSEQWLKNNEEDTVRNKTACTLKPTSVYKSILRRLRSFIHVGAGVNNWEPLFYCIGTREKRNRAGTAINQV